MFTNLFNRHLGFLLLISIPLFGLSFLNKPTDQAKKIYDFGEKGILFQSELPTVVLDSFIYANQREHNIPAVSLSIIKDGKIIYTKNYGVINSITKEPITEKSVFEAASITKPIFAYTVCRLAQKGIINLDSPLHKRFPFPELEKYSCYKDMTARHVLSHVSGLPNWGTNMINCPGKKYGYSGQGFEYLTKALARSFTQEMNLTIAKYLEEEEVITPFKMSNTYFTESNELKSFCVDGHLNNKPTKQIFPTSPEMAYGMHCDSEGIAKFAIALLNRSGLSEEMAKDMFTIHTIVPDTQKEFDRNYTQGYGLGLYIRNSQYGKTFGHSGSNGDFKSLFEVYDDLKMGYVIMTNSDTGDKLTKKMAAFLIEGTIN